jgi:hypothetical protein
VEEEEFLSVLPTHHFIVVSEQMVSVQQEQTMTIAELFVINVTDHLKDVLSTETSTVQADFHVYQHLDVILLVFVCSTITCLHHMDNFQYVVTRQFLQTKTELSQQIGQVKVDTNTWQH